MSMDKNSTPTGPSSFNVPECNPPNTPKSNFAISTPPLSSESSCSEGAEEDLEVDSQSEVDSRRSRAARESSDEEDDDDEDILAPSRRSFLDAESRGSRSIFGSRGSIHSDVLRRRRQALEGRTSDQEDDGMTDRVMTVIWANGKIGAAYYEMETAELFLLPDTAESAPDYWVLKSLFNQVMPRYLLANSRQDERMIKLMQELTGSKITEGGIEESQAVPERPETAASEAHNSQLFLLNAKEFSPDPCKQRILKLKIPYEPKDNTPENHNLFMASLIPFRSEIMIRAAGALLKFLDKSAIEIFLIDLVEGQIPVLDVKICTMDDMVLVDDSAWQSLQIFSTDIHPSSVKQGNQSASKEGLSVFSTLNHCSTVQGSRSLRLMLLRPCRSISTLNRRYDVIEFCCNPSNNEFVKSVADCLKAIKSFPKLLYKLSLLHASVAEWKDLYQTIYHCLLLAEICSSLPRKMALFSDISSDVNLDTLKTLSQEMLRVIDFDQSKTSRRIVAKDGIDIELDKRKQQYSCLPEIMSLVAREEMKSLPGFVHQCCIVYIPEVGYLVAISLWRDNLTREEMEITDMEFKFKTSELAYYKSPRTRELDLVLGDCSVAILEMETSIMIRLTERIIEKSLILLKTGAMVSELDSLIAMSTAAKNNNYVRPKIVHGDISLRILEGRHPLAELLCDFVPNDTHFEPREKVSLLTGPNASGKSIYLKQVGVIVIMALAGSFVPAKYAEIPTYDRICTRIHATESLSTGFSSFMIDLSQVSLALRMTTKSSLVIIDEFGKGTADADGLSLLVATIEDFTNRKENCPTIFLSTHFYSVVNYLEWTPMIKTQSMKFIIDENDADDNQVTYLFVLIDGVCESSFARMVATHVGISKALVDRSHAIENIIKNQLEDDCLIPCKSQELQEKEKLMIQFSEQFLTLDLETTDPKDYFASINSLVL